MDPDTRKAASAALAIFAIFAVGAYFLPRIMLALGNISPVLAGVFAVAFVLAFFAIFWLRGRFKRKE